MDKLNSYIEEQSAIKLQKWTGVGALIGATFWPVFSLADYFRPPDFHRFHEFLTYRIAISILFVILFFLNKIKRSRLFQTMICYTGILASAILNESMTLKLGGHQSPYYVGMIITMITGVGMLPLAAFYSIISGVLICLLYVIPIFIFDKIIDVPTFVLNNIYLFSTLVMTSILRIVSNKTMTNELRLQYQIEREKDVLDELVLKRTESLSKSEQWHRSIFENASDGIVIFNGKGKIVNINGSACGFYLCEKSTMAGRDLHALLENARGKEVGRTIVDILNGMNRDFEISIIKMGKEQHLQITAQHILIGNEEYTMIVSRDITDRKKYWSKRHK
jgi:PAS domain S-box-containing protein